MLKRFTRVERSWIMYDWANSAFSAIIAAIILRVLPEALRDFSDYRMLAYAILLIGIMLLSENKRFKAGKSQVSFRSLWNKVRAKFSKKTLAVATADAVAEEPNHTDSPKGGDGQ